MAVSAPMSDAFELAELRRSLEIAHAERHAALRSLQRVLRTLDRVCAEPADRAVYDEANALLAVAGMAVDPEWEARMARAAERWRR